MVIVGTAGTVGTVGPLDPPGAPESVGPLSPDVQAAMLTAHSTAAAKLTLRVAGAQLGPVIQSVCRERKPRERHTGVERHTPCRVPDPTLSPARRHGRMGRAPQATQAGPRVKEHW